MSKDKKPITQKLQKQLETNKKMFFLRMFVIVLCLGAIVFFASTSIPGIIESRRLAEQRLEKEREDELRLRLKAESLEEAEEGKEVEEDIVEEEEVKEETPAPTLTPAPAPEPNGKRVKKGEQIAILSEKGLRMGGALLKLTVYNKNGIPLSPFTTGYLKGGVMGERIKSGIYHKPLDEGVFSQFDGMSSHIGGRTYGSVVYAITDGLLGELQTAHIGTEMEVNYLILEHSDGFSSMYSHIE